MRLQEEPTIVQGTHKRPTFMLAIPTFGSVDIAFLVAMMRMALPVNASMQSFIARGMEIGVARNYAVEQVMKLNPRPEYLLFIGDDVLPGADSLLLLYEEMRTGNWDVLSGLYHMKAAYEGAPIPVMWRTNKNGPLQAGIDYEIGETVQVDVTGMDFCLIRTEIFDDLGPAPWFKTSDHTNMIQEDGSLNILTEDAYFARLLMGKGFRVGVATKVRLGHLNVKTGEVY